MSFPGWFNRPEEIMSVKVPTLLEVMSNVTRVSDHWRDWV